MIYVHNFRSWTILPSGSKTSSSSRDEFVEDVTTVTLNGHNERLNVLPQLLELVEFKLREVISRDPTLLVLVVGVPNVGKLALINSIHQIASSRFPVQEKMKRATVSPLPGVTQDIAGCKIAHQPSIYVPDTSGVLVPNIPDIETGLKLALAVVGECIAQYLLAILNTRGTPLYWKHLNNRRLEGIWYDSKEKHEYNLKDLRPKRFKPPNGSNMLYVEDLVIEVQCALYLTLLEYTGNVEDESDLESYRAVV
ncbi:short integuments 2, mitochondrial-like isoform X1 [Quercus lobata]|uniref:short integuments 2, mitochondrial-like isoform X1 n=1 Tax=Quercus lobata TaxID=97700 RepID=UPI0012459464|nr:short integuments 2, mitochondrial-like isoform X1 [Quercus lobata]